MKVKHLIVLMILAVVIIAPGCSTSNQVANNKLIQKRKYNKGVFIERGNYAFLKKKNKQQAENSTETEYLSQSNSPQETQTPVEVIETPIVNTTTDESIALNSQAAQIIETIDNPVQVTEPKTEKKSKIKQRVAEQLITKKAKAITKAIDTNIIEQQNTETVSATEPDPEDATLYYILAVVIPWLAVGLVTDWDVNKVLINLLLTLLCVIPGIIHAIITVKDSLGQE